ncbi:Zn(II)2Cys6 transcription factor domain-containing protein [Aspergillus ibericus CBS 121593]|uniref:Zn(2)-C6 fungal-type domain-containing protein n=1 Tax=Aspergillus ibericus CBS 121593 TaxID=1448316 RepID=A0A395GZJ9_9EURO|nr:hypothetical protein BO80DRAFT_356112 [Aspergillus ibericus CBS 121593]RAL00790.1 hypothetical protein BO80DRAFT_356112 [Aspergillus ibericus CBS 121593]
MTVSKPRLRRHHKKSRLGCSNCKLRRVKCDEAKPACKKCSWYGVVCSYDPGKGQNLQISQELEIPLPASADAVTVFELDTTCVNWLKWFQWAQTSVSILNVPQDDILRLARSHPFLMHIVLTMSSIHHRHLSLSESDHPRAFEAHHTSQCVQLLSEKLAHPIPPEERDAVWIGATFLGIVVFSLVSATTVEEVWPLKSDPSDLEWVRMTKNKMSLWTLIDPLRDDGLFRGMAGEYEEMFEPTATDASVPEPMARICHLDEFSTAENNPYFTALHTLLPLWDRSFEEQSRASVLAFPSQMTPAFRNLLHEKDSVALLLLALWYDIAGQVIWWSRQRATVELESICLYIQRYHPELQDLLP